MRRQDQHVRGGHVADHVVMRQLARVAQHARRARPVGRIAGLRPPADEHAEEWLPDRQSRIGEHARALCLEEMADEQRDDAILRDPERSACGGPVKAPGGDVAVVAPKGQRERLHAGQLMDPRCERLADRDHQCRIANGRH